VPDEGSDLPGGVVGEGDRVGNATFDALDWAGEVKFAGAVRWGREREVSGAVADEGCCEVREVSYHNFAAFAGCARFLLFVQDLDMGGGTVGVEVCAAG